ncbi:hypothetical protein ACFPA8_01685 [Streptomyces ovatisporus]|uniref:Secreted protein n=1 Tax=Streptomyces ovatisporus TaxID=1128682 RepID=A0ABV8ZYR7_9ACTN
MTTGAQPCPLPPPPEPAVGTAVRDTRRGRVGIVMAYDGPYVQLRPLNGGREWDADPGLVQLLSAAELLSARLAEVNERSRRRDR